MNLQLKFCQYLGLSIELRGGVFPGRSARSTTRNFLRVQASRIPPTEAQRVLPDHQDHDLSVMDSGNFIFLGRRF